MKNTSDIGSREFLLRKPEVLQQTGLVHSTLYYLINKGSFPKPVKLGKRIVAWKKSEIDTWIDQLTISNQKDEIVGDTIYA